MHCVRIRVLERVVVSEAVPREVRRVDLVVDAVVREVAHVVAYQVLVPEEVPGEVPKVFLVHQVVDEPDRAIKTQRFRTVPLRLQRQVEQTKHHQLVQPPTSTPLPTAGSPKQRSNSGRECSMRVV